MSSLLRSAIRFFRRRRAHYIPLVAVRVHTHALRENLRAFQKAFPSLAFAPVLKSNAYGHGLAAVARLFDRDALPFFAVDSYAEALILRNEGIRTPLLIIGYTLPENMRARRLRNVAFTIASIETLRSIAGRIEHLECHLKIDTGMHRQGITPDEIPDALVLLRAAPHIRITGVMTHLADADGDDDVLTKKQINAWNAAVRLFKENIPTLHSIHCSATAGSRYADCIDANVLRLGIGLYGCMSDIPIAVAPALELVSLVSAIRTVDPGERIGYNGTYTVQKRMRVATVPMGYAEGIDRRLSDIGTFFVHQTPCPIVGRVSMNMTTIDVTDIEQTVRVGDEVIAISAERGSANSCESIARQCGTIPYEILVHIPSTLRRNYI